MGVQTHLFTQETSPVLHSAQLYSFRTWLSLFLGKARVTDFGFCKQQKARVPGAVTQPMPARALSHTAVTRIWPSPEVSSARASYGTADRLRFQFLQVRRTVSIQSKKPVPDAIFFHHSFQTMLGLICTCCKKPRVLHSCPRATARRDAPKTYSRNLFLSSAQMLKTNQALSL